MELVTARLIRRYYDRLWNEWTFELIDEIISPSIIFRGSLGMEVKGRSGFRDYMETVRQAFPDFHNEIKALYVDGESVVAKLTYTGTHLGELFGVLGSGRRVSYTGVAIFHIQDEVIIDGWVLGDGVSLRRQIGAGIIP